MADDVNAELSDALQDLERGEATWPHVRRALFAAPGEVAPALFELLERWLGMEETPPRTELVIDALEHATRGHAKLVNPEPLRRIIARGDRFSWAAVLCAAAMLVRHDPMAILTEGLDFVLVATEIAFEDPQDADSAPAIEQFRQIATTLWATVARGDTPSLVAILESWVRRAGWDRAPAVLFAELLVRALPYDLALVPDSVAIFQSIDPAALDEKNCERLSEVLSELKGVREAWTRKSLAREIVAGLDPGKFRGRPPPLPPKRSTSGPDVRVDRLIERYLEGREWRARMDAAERRDPAQLSGEEIALLGSEPPEYEFFRALRKPWPALVEGICELVDELIETDPTDDRIETLVTQLCLAVGDRAKLIPVEALQRWLAKRGVFREDRRDHLYGCIAAVRPDWIVDQALADAAGAAMAARSSSLWRSLGVAYPGLLIQFAEAWLARIGHDDDFVTRMGSALVHVAMAEPDEINAILALLERYDGGEPEPGFIRLDDYYRLIAELKRIRDRQPP